MMDPFIGEIRAVGFDYAPRGWLLCDGSLLQISQYSSLFALLGTRYGGNGTTTFALPDLRGRTIIGFGTGPGMSYRPLGYAVGSEVTVLSNNNIPPISATLKAYNGNGDVSSPTDAILATTAKGSGPAAEVSNTYKNATPNVDMSSDSIEISGGGNSQPFNNMQPSLVLNYIIAYQGVFPPRP